MNIKKKIKESGLTLEQLGAKMGKSQQSMSHIINGNPSLSNLIKIAKILGISVSELLSDGDCNLLAIFQYEGKFYRADSIEEAERILADIKRINSV